MTNVLAGVQFYDGPSMLTGDRIVGICTGIDRASHNPKTGPIVQAWILRADRPPMDAKRANLDDAICGTCPLRGHEGVESGCYVLAWTAPHKVWTYFAKGGYPVATDGQLEAILEQRTVRLGAYGDPAAIPFEIWQRALTHVRGWIGYTHMWSSCDPRFKTIVMASVESLAGRERARAAGWRTFRIRAAVTNSVLTGECVCPASDEGGQRVTCEQCQLCRGTSRPARDIVIVAHGKPSSVRMFR